MAGNTSSRTSPTADIGRTGPTHRKSSSWRRLVLTLPARSGCWRPGSESVKRDNTPALD